MLYICFIIFIYSQRSTVGLATLVFLFPTEFFLPLTEGTELTDFYSLRSFVFFRQNDIRTFFFIMVLLLLRKISTQKTGCLLALLVRTRHAVSLLCVTSSRSKLNSKLYMRSNCFGFNPLYSNPNRNNTIFFLSMSGLDLFAGNDVATTRARFTSFV